VRQIEHNVALDWNSKNGRLPVMSIAPVGVLKNPARSLGCGEGFVRRRRFRNGPEDDGAFYLLDN
jgi:hypothetical protein